MDGCGSEKAYLDRLLANIIVRCKRWRWWKMRKDLPGDALQTRNIRKGRIYIQVDCPDYRG